MKRYVLLALLAALLVGLCATTATASIGITFDGVPDTLDDVSKAMAVSSNDNYLNVGDIVFGLVRIEKNITVSNNHVQISESLAEIIVAFAAEITGMTSLDTSPNYIEYTLGVPSGANVGYLKNQLWAHPLVGQNDMFAVLVMPEPGAPDPTGMTRADAYDALNNTGGESFTVFATGTLATGDYFKVRMLDRDGDKQIALTISGGEITGIPEYSTPSPLGTGATIGEERLGATYTFLPPGIVVASKVPLDDFTYASQTWHEVVLTGYLKPLVAGGKAEGGWLFADHSTMSTNLVPEPASVVCWLCLGGLALAGYAARRRKPVA